MKSFLSINPSQRKSVIPGELDLKESGQGDSGSVGGATETVRERRRVGSHDFAGDPGSLGVVDEPLAQPGAPFGEDAEELEGNLVVPDSTDHITARCSESSQILPEPSSPEQTALLDYNHFLADEPPDALQASTHFSADRFQGGILFDGITPHGSTTSEPLAATPEFSNVPTADYFAQALTTWPEDSTDPDQQFAILAERIKRILESEHHRGEATDWCIVYQGLVRRMHVPTRSEIAEAMTRYLPPPIPPGFRDYLKRRIGRALSHNKHVFVKADGHEKRHGWKVRQ